jgi:hypothetical protein
MTYEPMAASCAPMPVVVVEVLYSYVLITTFIDYSNP